MEVGEMITIPELTPDLKDECPFDHELEEPPEVNNDLLGKGSKLATKMNNGSSTNVYPPYAPDQNQQVKLGKLPQKDPNHPFCKQGSDKGRCVAVHFATPEKKTQTYPVSCSAHHLVPSQESLKNHDLLQYMCKKGTGQEHNHGYADGRVWSDVGYDTNGSENGIYLPGTYAVGGAALNVWFPIGANDDAEHDDGYIESDKATPKEYEGFLLSGKRGEIRSSNPCWQYAAQAMVKAPGQFHDRHLQYSKDIVKAALTNIYEKYKRHDITRPEGACPKCKDRNETIKKHGLPAPYSVVLRLQNMAKVLCGCLKFSRAGQLRSNVFTSEWCKKYMDAVLLGGHDREEAEQFEPREN
jgi:hypothetical protein